MRRYLTLACLAIALFVSKPRSAEAFTKAFTYSEISTALAGALQSFQIYLHNEGPFKDGTHFRPNISTIRLNGKRLSSFSVEPFPVGRVGGRSYFYYIEALNSSGVGVETRDKGFYLTLSLASSEAPLIPKCVKKAATGKAEECDPYPFPKIGLSSVKLIARLEPVAHKGSIAFTMTKAEVQGSPDISYCQGLLAGFACNKIARLPAFAARVRKKLEDKVLATFNTPAALDAAAIYLRDNTDVGLIAVTAVAVRDANVVVTGRVRLLGASF